MPQTLKIARGFLTTHEQKDFLDCCPKTADRIIFLMMLDLGLRLDEVSKPTLGDLMARTVTLKGKGETWRHLPTTNRLRMVAQAIVSETERTVDDSASLFAPRTIQKHFHKTVRAAGITKSGLSCHALRHSYACNLVNQGIPMPAIQALMGHANLATTAAYLHISDDHLRKAEAALERANGSAPPEDSTLQALPSTRCVVNPK